MIGDCKRLFGCLSIAVYKAQQYPSACKNHYGSNQYGCYDSDKKSLTVPEPDALFFSCAEVLACIGRHRKSVGGSGYFEHAVQFICCRKSRDKSYAESVDHRLNDHAADRNDTVLKSHRHAELHQAGMQPGLNLAVFFLKL